MNSRVVSRIPITAFSHLNTMSVLSPTIHPNYQHLARYLILTKAEYAPVANDVQVNWDEIDPSLRNFTPVTDNYLNEQLDFFEIKHHFRIKRAARRYKVIPSRTQVAESLLLCKALQCVSADPKIALDDFVLFALPQITLAPHFEAKLAAILDYVHRPEFQHIDCVILDYGYLGTTHNLVSLLQQGADYQQPNTISNTDNDNSVDNNISSIDTNLDSSNTVVSLEQQLQGTKLLQYTKIFTNTIRTFKVDLNAYTQALAHDKNDNDSTITTSNEVEFTVATPSKMGITFSHCLLIRKSRMAKIIQQSRPTWLFSDVKRYIPVARTLIVTPGIVHNPYPIYQLDNSQEDILELIRRRIKHQQPIDRYRDCMHRLLPCLHTSMSSKYQSIRKFSQALQKLLLIDF